MRSASSQKIDEVDMGAVVQRSAAKSTRNVRFSRLVLKCEESGCRLLTHHVALTLCINHVDICRPLLAIFTNKSIPNGDELTIDYNPSNHEGSDLEEARDDSVLDVLGSSSSTLVSAIMGFKF